jgi:hypothetical protein
LSLFNDSHAEAVRNPRCYNSKDLKIKTKTEYREMVKTKTEYREMEPNSLNGRVLHEGDNPLF